MDLNNISLCRLNAVDVVIHPRNLDHIFVAYAGSLAHTTLLWVTDILLFAGGVILTNLVYSNHLS